MRGPFRGRAGGTVHATASFEAPARLRRRRTSRRPRQALPRLPPFELEPARRGAAGKKVAPAHHEAVGAGSEPARRRSEDEQPDAAAPAARSLERSPGCTVPPLTPTLPVHPPRRLRRVGDREPEPGECLLAEQLPGLSPLAVPEAPLEPACRGGAKAAVAVEDEHGLASPVDRASRVRPPPTDTAPPTGHRRGQIRSG